jgi:tetratricopeptide (TPR) repeat protein
VALVDCLFEILGHTGVRIDGRITRSWGTAKARAMLAVLLTRPRQWVSTETLLEWMWAEDDDLPGNPAQTFYNYANRIREALKRMDARPELTGRKGAYRIDVDKTSIDFFRSRELLDHAREAGRHDHRRCGRLAGLAVELWSDDPLADVRGEPAAEWRRAARENTWLPALDAWCGSLSALGEHQTALALLEDLQLGHANSLVLVMRRLEALHGLSRGGDARVLYLGVYRRFMEDFDHQSADALKHFYDGLAEPAARPVVPVNHVVPHQLPHDVDDFTGRDVLLAKMTATAVDAARGPRPCVVVLDGQGGVGKTALAVHWARQVAEHFTGGQLYVDLGAFSDSPRVEPATVVDRFLEGLGVAADQIAEPERRATRLQTLVNDRAVLVLLDNAADSDHVKPLLRLLSTCVVVVTSRRQLTGLASSYGCHRFPVEPLSDTDGARLLSIRTGARCADEPVALAELARMCIGLPIVLNLLAQYVIGRPAALLSEFVEQLRHDVRVLDLGSSGDGADHSVRAIFAQSYRALTEDGQRLFRLLALHPGQDITVDVALALAGGERRQVLVGLSALVSAYLLAQPGALTRYRFHDLLRDYAGDRLAEAPEAERAAAESRMLEFYLHTAKRADARLFPFRPGVEVAPQRTAVQPLRFTDERSAMRWCVTEMSNVTAVLRYAADRGAHAFVGALPLMVGEILTRLGAYEEVLANLRLAQESAASANNDEGVANALHSRGYVHLMRREFRLAENCFHDAHRIFRALGDEAGVAVALHSTARLFVELGEVVMGIDSHERALRMIRRVGHRALEAAFLYRIGEAHRRAFDFDQAFFYCRESLRVAVELGDVRAQGVALVEMGEMAYDQGDSAAAEGYCGRMLAMAEHTHDFGTAGRACSVLSATSLAAGRLFDAKQYARKGVQLCGRVGLSSGTATALDRLAETLKRSGQLEGAVEGWERAKSILDDLGSPRAEEIGRELALLTATLDAEPPAARRDSPLPRKRRPLV